MNPNDGKEPDDGNDLLDEAGDVDFGDVFDTFASKPEDVPAEKTAATEPEADPDEEQIEPELSQPPANPGGENKQAAPEPGPAGEPSTDPWANAPAELKAEHERLKHQLASATGRLSVADRHLAELRKAQKADAPGADGGDDGNKDSRAAPKPASFRENPKVKQLLEEYPDVAIPLVDIIEGQQRTLDALSKPVADLTQERNQTHATEQLQIVAERHPDLAQVVNDPRYPAWLAGQPRAVREAYERNQSQVVDGVEAAWVLDMFKRDAGFKTDTSAPPEAPKTDPTSSGAAAGDSRRQRQLDGNRDSGGSRGTAKPDADPNDLDAQFSIEAAKLERRRRQALGSV